MDIRKRFPHKLDSIYKEMENIIEVKWPLSHNGELVSTYEAQLGELFPIEKNKGILFYGRASNGWDRDNPNGDDGGEVYDMSKISKEAKKRKYFELIEKISSRILKIEDWYNYISISNITKVVFCYEGNPSDELWNQQYKYLAPILRTEIKLLSPQIIIFIIGNAIKCGYEKPVFEAFPFLKEDKYLVDERIWGSYETQKETRELKTTAYNYEGKLLIFTDRPDSLFSKQFMKEHVNVICNIISKFYDSIDE